MDTIRRVYAFRHGQTDWNAEGRIQGHLDIPLNDLGRTQAQSLITPLQAIQVQAILSSDLSRARETAEIAMGESSLLLHTDSRLREIFLGKAQGLTRPEIESQFGADLSSRLRDHPLSDAEVSILGSESGDHVWNRATDAIIEFFTQQPKFQTIAICSHGGVLRRLIQRAHRTDTGQLTAFDQIGWIGNASLYPLTINLSTRKWFLELSLPWPLR